MAKRILKKSEVQPRFYEVWKETFVLLDSIPLAESKAALTILRDSVKSRDLSKERFNKLSPKTQEVAFAILEKHIAYVISVPKRYAHLVYEAIEVLAEKEGTKYA